MVLSNYFDLCFAYFVGRSHFLNFDVSAKRGVEAKAGAGKDRLRPRPLHRHWPRLLPRVLLTYTIFRDTAPEPLSQNKTWCVIIQFENKFCLHMGEKTWFQFEGTSTKTHFENDAENDSKSLILTSIVGNRESSETDCRETCQLQSTPDDSNLQGK